MSLKSNKILASTDCDWLMLKKKQLHDPNPSRSPPIKKTEVSGFTQSNQFKTHKFYHKPHAIIKHWPNNPSSTLHSPCPSWYIPWPIPLPTALGRLFGLWYRSMAPGTVELDWPYPSRFKKRCFSSYRLQTKHLSS